MFNDVALDVALSIGTGEMAALSDHVAQNSKGEANGGVEKIREKEREVSAKERARDNKKKACKKRMKKKCGWFARVCNLVCDGLDWFERAVNLVKKGLALVVKAYNWARNAVVWLIGKTLGQIFAVTAVRVGFRLSTFEHDTSHLMFGLDVRLLGTHYRDLNIRLSTSDIWSAVRSVWDWAKPKAVGFFKSFFGRRRSLGTNGSPDLGPETLGARVNDAELAELLGAMLRGDDRSRAQHPLVAASLLTDAPDDSADGLGDGALDSMSPLPVDGLSQDEIDMLEAITAEDLRAGLDDRPWKPSYMNTREYVSPARTGRRTGVRRRREGDDAPLASVGLLGPTAALRTSTHVVITWFFTNVTDADVAAQVGSVVVSVNGDLLEGADVEAAKVVVPGRPSSFVLGPFEPDAQIEVTVAAQVGAGEDPITLIGSVITSTTASIGDCTAGERDEEGDEMSFPTGRASRVALLAGCERLGGAGLFVGAVLDSGEEVDETCDVESLAALSSLRVVDGSLHVAGCESLATLAELAALESVGEDLAFRQLPLVKSLSMPALHTVGEVMQVGDLDALDTIDLPSLVTVGEYLMLIGLPVLVTLDEPFLSSASALGGLYVANLTSLEHLGGVAAATSLQQLTISGNPVRFCWAR